MDKIYKFIEKFCPVQDAEFTIAETIRYYNELGYAFVNSYNLNESNYSRILFTFIEDRD